ncbi:MAG: hypothetical protein LBJ08_06780, partial [Bifidobacteriaceae bacterium]|nr:hypothetical protein [Bifidobacteriaceae bacterium]
MNRTARAMIGLAAVTMGVAAPAYGDDGGTSVVGWEGTSDISHSVKHPERQVTLTGVHGKQYRLQLKTADGWRTADVGQVDPGATTLLVTLPETWRSRANSAWRLKLSAPRVGALYTGSWKIHRTPR